MAKPKHQRLVLGLAALVAIGGAAVLALSGMQDTVAFFCSPSDVATKTPAGDCGRLGGMVEKGSIQRGADGISIRFVVSDGQARVPVAFKGVTPDLFREESGVVAEGRFQPDGSYLASNILAKHDERYMPPQIAGNLHKTDTLQP